MKRAMTTERDLLLVNIERDIADLVQRRQRTALLYVLEHTGYIDNSTSHTTAEIGAAIVALARVVAIDWTRGIAEGAAFHRAKTAGKSHEQAQRAGDRAANLPRLQAVAS